MNDIIQKLVVETDIWCDQHIVPVTASMWERKFAELIVQECIHKIETYRIPVGNSRSGELACDWTYNSLKEIRDEIKEHFGIE